MANEFKPSGLNDYLRTHEGKDALLSTLAEALEEQTLATHQFEEMFEKQQKELIDTANKYELLRERWLTMLSDLLIICDEDGEEDFVRLDKIRSYVDGFMKREV